MQRNIRHYRSLVMLFVVALVGWWLAVMTIIATLASVRIVLSTLRTQQTNECRLSLSQPECNNVKSGSFRNAYELKYDFKCCDALQSIFAILSTFAADIICLLCWMSSKELLLSLLLSALYSIAIATVSTIFTLTTDSNIVRRYVHFINCIVPGVFVSARTRPCIEICAHFK